MLLVDITLADMPTSIRVARRQYKNLILNKSLYFGGCSIVKSGGCFADA